MLKAQDVVVLLRLLGEDAAPGQRQLAGELSFDLSGINRSLRRLADAGLYDTARRHAPAAPAEEFLLHAVKYLWPVRRGGESRGIPTAWAAAPLAGQLTSTELPPVWPHALGRVRGIAFEPLHPIVPDAARANPALGERLALLDAIRGGDARSRRIATAMLHERLDTNAAA